MSDLRKTVPVFDNPYSTTSEEALDIIGRIRDLEHSSRSEMTADTMRQVAELWTHLHLLTCGVLQDKQRYTDVNY